MRSPLQRRAVASALLLGAVACAGLPGAGPSPKELRARADEAIAAGELEVAYDRLAEIYRQDPESPQSAEAFPLAAGLLQKLYMRNRYKAPESRWLTTEPEFVFDWFATLFNGEFPHEEAQFLFKSLPYSFFVRFEAYAATDPKLADWPIRAIEDNGRIKRVFVESSESVDAAPPPARRAPTPQSHH